MKLSFLVAFIKNIKPSQKKYLIKPLRMLMDHQPFNSSMFI